MFRRRFIALCLALVPLLGAVYVSPPVAEFVVGAVDQLAPMSEAVALTPVQRAILKRGVSPVYQCNYLAGALCGAESFSRAGNATQFDSTGKLTYAPNNWLLYSNTFTNAAWSNITMTITNVNAVADPFGGTNATTLAAAGATSIIQQFTARDAATGLNTLWMRRRTGTGQISFIKPDGSDNYVTLTGTWQQVTSTSAQGGTYFYFGVQINTAGDAIDVYYGTSSKVTYETTPRTADQVITTSSAYYGPRIDYDPNTLAVKGLLIEEARTNLLVNSKSDGTNLATQNVTVTAQPYTLTFYGTGSVTLSGASTSGPLSGSGAFPTRSTLTFTPSAGTLTLTVAGTVQYAQLEAGSFATSYIPTAAASVTRAADVVQFTGAALTALQGSAGSAIVQSKGFGLSNSRARIISTTSDSPLNAVPGTSVTVDTYNAAVQILNSGSPVDLTSTARYGVAWSASGRSIAANGGAVGTDANQMHGGSTAQAWLGSQAGVSAWGSGWYQSLAFYNQRLPDATLQAKSIVGASFAANDNETFPRYAANDNLPIIWRRAM